MQSVRLESESVAIITFRLRTTRKSTQHYFYLLSMIALILPSLLVCTPLHAEISSLDFRLSFDKFISKQSDLEGTNGISLLKRFDNNFYWGGTIYSATLGRAGGFFVGGFEAGKIVALPNRFFIDGQFYAGGGGGASQVPGSGLMLRPRLSVGKTFDRFSLMLGPSWVKITGSEISTASLEFAIKTPLDLAYEGGHIRTTHDSSGQLKLHEVKLISRRYIPHSNTKRNSSAALGNMDLAGIEFTFDTDGPTEIFVQANGVVHGDAEGYADWYLGVRRFLAIGPVQFFADVSSGIGGGGAVDTGGGINVNFNTGAQIPVAYDLYLEPAVAYLYSPNGNFSAVSPNIKLGIPLGGHYSNMQSEQTLSHWQVSTGVTYMPENSRLRKPYVTNTGSPSVLDLKIDTFMTRYTYLTGQAYTAFAGDAGGFQIGLIGLGHQFHLNQQWGVSGELLLGAGGGAGVDTSGGALAASHVDLDYALSDSLSAFVGAGWIRTVKDSGMSGITYDTGLKFLFTLFH